MVPLFRGKEEVRGIGKVCSKTKCDMGGQTLWHISIPTNVMQTISNVAKLILFTDSTFSFEGNKLLADSKN